VAGVVAETTPDLVILDLQIGNMGGIAACLHLRNEAGDGRLPEVPVLMLLDRDADVHLARRSGAEGWVVKPLDAFALRAKATEVLRQGASG
jgi:two-component system nitrate/nitrite response regulator NarL